VKTPYLIGDQIYLRPLEPSDLNERYLGWLNDAEVSRYMESGVFPQSKAQLEKFYQQVVQSSNQVMLAIADRASDEHIGNVKLGPIHWIYRKATLGIMLGEKRFWGRGIGKEVLRLIVEYAFDRLNLEKVELGVIADHLAAVRCYEQAQFRIEGRMRNGVFCEGQYKDSLWMGLLRSEYVRSQQNQPRDEGMTP
jgi:[ribosomal protein S5]-alanine N-acetyltransferase